MEMFSLMFSGSYIYYRRFVTSGDSSVSAIEQLHYKQQPAQSVTHITQVLALVAECPFMTVFNKSM